VLVIAWWESRIHLVVLCTILCNKVCPLVLPISCLHENPQQSPHALCELLCHHSINQASWMFVGSQHDEIGSKGNMCLLQKSFVVINLHSRVVWEFFNNGEVSFPRALRKGTTCTPPPSKHEHNQFSCLTLPSFS